MSKKAPPSRVILNKAGKEALSYLAPRYLENGFVFHVYSFESEGPYLVIKAHDFNEPDEPFELMIPHHFVELIAIGERVKEIGFHARHS